MPAEEDEAGRMQSELDELDEHIDDARKKAQRTREQSDLDDDPSGALDEPSEKGH